MIPCHNSITKNKQHPTVHILQDDVAIVLHITFPKNYIGPSVFFSILLSSFYTVHHSNSSLYSFGRPVQTADTENV